MGVKMQELPAEVASEIVNILNHGNNVELKMIHGEIMVTEVYRKLKCKSTANS